MVTWRLYAGVTLATVLVTPFHGAAQSSQLETLNLESELVPGPVEVGVLLPPGYDERERPYSLLLFLHGGGGNSSFLEQMRPVFDAAWR